MRGLDHFLTAIHSIAQNKVRSLLTTLGVIIGVMSVILLVALGESVQAYVQKEFAVMGSNILIITPGKQETVGIVPITAGSNHKLTYEIAKTIKRKAAGVTGVAANIMGLTQVRYGKRSRSVLTFGTTPDFDRVRQLYTQIGRFITDRDIERNNRVCVIGVTLKRELFGDENALYKRVTVNGQEVKADGKGVATPGGAVVKVNPPVIRINGQQVNGQPAAGGNNGGAVGGQIIINGQAVPIQGPGRIVLIGPNGVVNSDSAQEPMDENRAWLGVKLSLVPEAAVGSWVLVHAGHAIAVLEEKEARETYELLRQAEIVD